MVSKKSKPIKKVRHKKENKPEETRSSPQKSQSSLWQITSLVLGMLVIVSVLTNGFRFDRLDAAKQDLSKIIESGVSDDAKLLLEQAIENIDNAQPLVSAKDEQEPSSGDTSSDDIPTGDGVNLIVINDRDCVECQAYSQLISQLEDIFPDLSVTQYDYSDSQGRSLYDELSLSVLPVFLFDESVKQGAGYADVQNFLDSVGDYYSLRVGASYDPNSEICDNGVDDRDQDGLVDCEDPECSSEWKCMEKRDTPEVQLFVMSHCPYGTQMEKAALPAAEALGDKIDFKIRFVYYAMHGQTEVDEQTRQYCIQKDQEEKFLPYLRCFLEEGNTEACLASAGIDTDSMDSCVEAADEEFQITESFEDKTTWLNGRYPLFNTDKELNAQYGVGGSPTLVINDVVASVARTPDSLLDAICTGFTDKPEECDQELSTSSPSPGFGFTETTANTGTQATCG